MDKDTIIIGKGTLHKGSWGTMAISKWNDISQNKVFFNVHNCILGLDCIIYKNTSEGEILSHMIKAEAYQDKLMNFINKQVVKHLNYTLISRKIEEIKTEYMQIGEHDKAKQIREVLEINNG